MSFLKGLFGGSKEKNEVMDVVDYNEISFKCPYCFQKIMVNGVAFRSMTAYTNQDLEAFTAEEREKKKLYMLAVDGLYEKFWNDYPGSKPKDVEGDRTYERHPVLSPFDDRFVTNEKLMNGSKLVFQKDQEGFLHEAIDSEGKHSKVRICPHCHNRLPFEFGKYPIKYIPVVGITSSGKTIYLSQMLGKIKQILVRAGMTVAGLCPEVDAFVRSHPIRRGADLPIGNVRNRLTTPISINVKNNKTGKRYTLVFYDIAGENCVDPDQMEKYGQFIRNADGIIMMMDPKQFPTLVYLENDDEVYEDAYSPDRVVAAMYNAFLSADNIGGKSTVPLAVTLSKSDLLKGTEVTDENYNMFRNIPYEEYTARGLPYEEWLNINTEVEILLSKKSVEGEVLDNSLKQFFPNHSYFAISALNGTPIASQDGTGKQYQMQVNPEAVRVEEPLFWILYKLGIIAEVKKDSKRR